MRVETERVEKAIEWREREREKERGYRDWVRIEKECE